MAEPLSAFRGEVIYLDTMLPYLLLRSAGRSVARWHWCLFKRETTIPVFPRKGICGHARTLVVARERVGRGEISESKVGRGLSQRSQRDCEWQTRSARCSGHVNRQGARLEPTARTHQTL